MNKNRYINLINDIKISLNFKDTLICYNGFSINDKKKFLSYKDNVKNNIVHLLCNRHRNNDDSVYEFIKTIIEDANKFNINIHEFNINDTIPLINIYFEEIKTYNKVEDIVKILLEDFLLKIDENKINSHNIIKSLYCFEKIFNQKNKFKNNHNLESILMTTKEILNKLNYNEINKIRDNFTNEKFQEIILKTLSEKELKLLKLQNIEDKNKTSITTNRIKI